MSSDQEVSDLIDRTEDANEKIHNLVFDIIPNLVEDLERNKSNFTKKQYYDIGTFGKMLGLGMDTFKESFGAVRKIMEQEPVGGSRRKRRSTRRRQTRRHR